MLSTGPLVGGAGHLCREGRGVKLRPGITGPLDASADTHHHSGSIGLSVSVTGTLILVNGVYYGG